MNLESDVIIQNLINIQDLLLIQEEVSVGLQAFGNKYVSTKMPLFHTPNSVALHHCISSNELILCDRMLIRK